MDESTYDVVVIGAGPAGEACASHVAESGGSVVIVERELVGGECPYWGCMPSKALLRPLQALAEARRTPGAAEALSGAVGIDAALERRDDVVRRLDDSSHAERLAGNGVTIVRGRGRIVGERRVVVEQDNAAAMALIAAKAVIIATGSRAAMPPIDGLADARAWTNREATLTPEIPTRLGVLGGGVIGVELAQAFAGYGSEVTILEAGDRILAREEPDAAQLVTAALRDAGVSVSCGSAVTRVRRGPDGAVTVRLESGDEVECDELLVAVGRAGNVEDLGLDSVGVEPGKGGTIEVSDCMQVGATDWLYAIGDVNGRAQLTHTAVYQADIAARNALGIPTYCVQDEFAAPRIVFTDPNLCAIGYTKASAEAEGRTVRVFDRDPQRVAAGSFYGRGTTGFARLILDADTDLVIGATFVGADLAELLHSATIAIVGEVPVQRLRHCVPAFPTRSEVWSRFIDMIDADDRARAAKG